MSCVVNRELMAPLPFRQRSFWQRLFHGRRGRRDAGVLRLDLCELSDHLKRDLGFLDGRC